ncbi:hypothetical protein SAMN04488515_0719 [Cognatiyoonia koreensis]|uniref:Uncharacterized protein n=1 Tax=Cognatiyoonia koreensis TaxID=364200 RepID=A0A1I0NMJ8_9RHOB|nr:hypothetical protein [Cognatiyoonia koreensis]SEW02764.1 hypothetical protein SAMN04488515_0719 [Cognatiyoonia koreensis]
MAERVRSKDGKSETEEFLPETDTPDQQGRSGGHLQRRVGTRDELRKVTQGGESTTRVTKGDELATGEDTRDD